LAELPEAVPMAEEPTVFTPGPEEETVTISRENDLFILQGLRLEKLVAMTDFNNEDGVKRFQRLFRLWGHEDALKAAGAKNGDSVRIKDLEFTFWQEEDD
jgi:GTP-binding protein